MAGIKLNLLGCFEATLDEDAPLLFDSDKDRALLIYLVVSANHPIRRGSLTGLLWPEHAEGAARHSLSQAIYALRKSFHQHGVSDPFEVTPQALLFRLEDYSSVDFYHFDRLIQAYIQHWAQPDITSRQCMENLELACEIYRGDFCAGMTLKECETYEEWLCFQRELYHLKFMRVLEVLIQSFSLVGDSENALVYAYKKVFQDPYDESSHRQVIQLLIKLGQRKQAIKHFKSYQQMLISELNTSPSNEMMKLYEDLLSIS